jgi:hypothetical protein
MGWPASVLWQGWAAFDQPVIVDGRHPKDLPDSRWINTVMSYL